MQPAAYPVPYQELTRIWSAFIESGQIAPADAAILDPAVLLSWRRCAPRLGPHIRPRPNTLKGPSLASTLKAQRDLVAVATPFMEDMHQFTEGSNCAIILTDGAACILVLCGDPGGLELVQSLGLGEGTYWSEGQLGTNGLAIALLDATPSQVVAAEHYFHACHHLASTAAPIHDVNGRIIGLLGAVGPAASATSHTLALLMAAARAIGNQLQTEWYLQEANRHLTEVNTILEAISEGVIAWNESGKIVHVNAPAGRLFHILPAAVLGRPFHEVVQWPPLIEQALAGQQELRDVEVNFQVNGQPLHCLVSLRPMFEGPASPIGHLVMLRPIEQVRRLVHQQVGVQATLRLEDVAAESAAMRRIVRQARIAARGTAPVLLSGEGGVGKNPLARAIHNHSPRADKPFIAINCQAIPHELMVGEFLGYEKGLASDGRPSKFELAQDGTLLLDQIEHLSLEMQAALLHLLETGHVMRLGSVQPVPVDVRIIATSPAKLEQLVADGSFLPHLYYRFGVFHFNILPLRDRVEDIPLLAERVLARITQRDGRMAYLSDEALPVLCRYPWPGNVRELESILERAVNQSQDGVIRLADLPERVRRGRVITSATPFAQPILSVSEAEREAIIQAGWACQGQVTAMAEQLGIGRTTLWRKMKRLKVSPKDFKKL